LVDSAYTGNPFAQVVHGTLGSMVSIAGRSALHTFAVVPKRWAVGRSLAWLESCRRL